MGVSSVERRLGVPRTKAVPTLLRRFLFKLRGENAHQHPMSVADESSSYYIIYLVFLWRAMHKGSTNATCLTKPRSSSIDDTILEPFLRKEKDPLGHVVCSSTLHKGLADLDKTAFRGSA